MSGKPDTAPPTEFRAKDGTLIEPGQVWAYRRATSGPVDQVEVQRLGTSKPARVKVRFADDKHEGCEDWVPPSRLKVLWSHVDEWQAREAKWTAVRDGAPADDNLEEMAACWIFDILRRDWTLAEMGWGRDMGLLLVPDVDQLAESTGIDRKSILEPPAFTDDDGTLVAPWPAAKQVAQLLAKKYSGSILAYLDNFERKRNMECTYGYMSRHGFISPEICAEAEAEHSLPYQLVRDWCGKEAQSRRDELQALRTEVQRLGELIERAVTALKDAGQTSAAKALERDLGIPVEVLRKGREHTRAFSNNKPPSE